MPRADYKTCRICGRHVDEVGELSHTRLCAEHSEARYKENVDGLHYKRGPALERWRRGMILSAGGILPDSLFTTTTERT